MFFNVWFVIWPAQKIALGIQEADADAKAAAARRAMLFSRTNTSFINTNALRNGFRAEPLLINQRSTLKAGIEPRLFVSE